MFHYQSSVYYFPYRNILYETIRNTFPCADVVFDVFVAFIVGDHVHFIFVFRKLEYDILASSLIEVAIVFGILGLITGSIWAKFTWGSWWTRDIKLDIVSARILDLFCLSDFAYGHSR